MDGDDVVTYTLPAGHEAYIHVARGSVSVNDTALSAGDGAKINGERELRLTQGDGAEVLLFDMA